VCARLVSIVSSGIIASAFGTSDAMDACVLAGVIPNYILNVVGASFNAALIPVYLQVRKEKGPEEAGRLFSSVVAMSLGLLTLVALIMLAFAPILLPILGSGFSPAKLALTRTLFYILLPTTVLSGLITNFGAILNAHEDFAIAAIAPSVVNIVQIIYLYSVVHAWGIYGLAAMSVVGNLLQLALLTWGLKRYRIRLWQGWSGIDENLKNVLKQYLPLVAGASVMSSTALVDQAITATLGSGSVAILNYGNRLPTIITGIGVTALGTAVLPYFSKVTAARDWPGVRRLLKTYSRLIATIAISITLIIVLLSHWIIRFIYQHGHFSAADTNIVSLVQIMFILELPFYAVGILYVRMISAMQANFILTASAAINFILNIVLDFVFMRYMGVAGIALATTIVYVLSCGYLGFMLYWKLRQIEK